MAMRHLIHLLVLIWTSLILSGCDSEYVFPSDMATMAEVYDDHLSETRLKNPNVYDARKRLSREIEPEDIDLAGYTRDANNEIEALFPRLPNPTLVMYVFPHLATNERHPVPGYSTSFQMYESVEYALPGEVPDRLTQ